MPTKQPMEALAVCALPTLALSAALRSSHECIARLCLKLRGSGSLFLTMYFCQRLIFSLCER